MAPAACAIKIGHWLAGTSSSCARTVPPLLPSTNDRSSISPSIAGPFIIYDVISDPPSSLSCLLMLKFSLC